MKTHKEFHLQLIADLKKVKLSAIEIQECPISSDNSIAVMSVTTPSSTSISKTYSDEEKNRKVTYLSVRSNNRELSKCKVNKLLEKYKSQRLITYTESNAPSLGSKGGFSVNLNNKTIIIVFKFRNGMESTNFGGWNESKFGSSDITGKSSIEFWTQNKKATTKWNAEAKVNWMS